MDSSFSPTEKTGDIVARFSKAAEIFKRHGIDFCCGGDRPLGVAIREHNLDEDVILRELSVAYEKFRALAGKEVDWRQRESGELVDHIIDNHHAYLRRELPELGMLTTKILQVHGVNHPFIAQVHRLFHSLKLELEQHLIKEEQVLFPLIKDLESDPSNELVEKVRGVIAELEGEHDGAGDTLKELRRITDQYRLPGDACGTFALTYQKLQELESDVFQHIHLENNILFPRLK